MADSNMPAKNFSAQQEAVINNTPGQKREVLRHFCSRSACLWCVCVCRVRWACPSVVRIIRPRPPSSTPTASLRLHQPETAELCRARQVAAPDRSGVPLAKPFVLNPFGLLRRCSRRCSSRGAKRLPPAAEGHDTASAFFRPPPGAPSSLR